MKNKLDPVTLNTIDAYLRGRARGVYDCIHMYGRTDEWFVVYKWPGGRIIDLMSKIKPTVELIGENGNAFVILGKVVKTLRHNGYSKEEIEQYKADATAGDYDHLLAVTGEWVNII